MNLLETETQVIPRGSERMKNLCVKTHQAFVLVISRVNYLLRFTRMPVRISSSPYTVPNAHAIRAARNAIKFSYIIFD